MSPSRAMRMPTAIPGISMITSSVVTNPSYATPSRSR
jgi:hypothetical protein